MNLNSDTYTIAKDLRLALVETSHTVREQGTGTPVVRAQYRFPPDWKGLGVYEISNIDTDEIEFIAKRSAHSTGLVKNGRAAVLDVYDVRDIDDEAEPTEGNHIGTLVRRRERFGVPEWSITSADGTEFELTGYNPWVWHAQNISLGRRMELFETLIRLPVSLIPCTYTLVEKGTTNQCATIRTPVHVRSKCTVEFDYSSSARVDPLLVLLLAMRVL